MSPDPTAHRQLYAEIRKIDDEARMVFGYASTQALDSQGEIVAKSALEGALPAYMRFANIREMHQPQAVGVAKDAEIDDKGLYLAAHVIDDSAWAKVKAGVYKGFSIGGRVTARDEAEPFRITGLELTEISLVDRPANPEAVFDLVKGQELAKAGARHSAADQGHLERICNALRALGHCACDQDQPAKAPGDAPAKAGHLPDSLAQRLDKLALRLSRLEAQPEAKGPVLKLAGEAPRSTLDLIRDAHTRPHGFGR